MAATAELVFPTPERTVTTRVPLIVPDMKIIPRIVMTVEPSSFASTGATSRVMPITATSLLDCGAC